MKIRITRRALRHLDEVRAYIAVDNPAAANKTIARLREAINGLTLYPERGRPGRIVGTRELVVSGTPYIVPYRLTGDAIDILAVLHGARAWPGSRPISRPR
ncbi:type II toxin-antitoxin system RelE/ParE family toxin [Methylobacterium sp. NFXW15]|uniref:type II toxin-antitoxin system RelE/ParE family toxin n=1 Tax=Methylobacterium sp. NFXW15 TaxID=2819512 RepID=UPI003CF3CE9C